jgi:LacI family transcriptional regulator
MTPPKTPTTSKVKISDIAKESQVSLSTVSMVLRNKEGIHPDTRSRVLDSAKALGYRLKDKPRLRPQGKIMNLGLIVKSKPNDPLRANLFYGDVVAGIEASCRSLKVNMLYATMPVDDDNQPVEVPNLLLDDSVDALLFVGAFVDETLSPLLLRHTIPVVLVDAYSNSEEYDAVVSENFQGAYQIVRYLIEKGHRQIALIGSHPQAYPSLRDRRRGYLQALADHQIATPYFADCPIDPQLVFEATTQLLIAQPEITALFGCNDSVAIAAMRAAQLLGRRLPEDLSIVGFDDIDPAHFTTPTLTTMFVDKVDMGQRAVQLLLHRAEYPDSARVTTVLRPRLVERDSVKNLL